MTRILIVEDEDRIASFVEKGLRAEGYSPEIAEDGYTAIELVRTGRFDLVILDLGLPGLDGFSVLRLIRGARLDLPVIILTARESTEDTVAGLSGGADDYMSKPFAFDELLARVRLRLRPSGPQNPSLLRAGDLALDIHTRRALVGERAIELSSREFTLLEVFLHHPDQVLSRAQLLSRVWGLDFDPGSNVVDVYVRYLREKLGHDTIETIRGAGYRLRVGG
ncbi:MULTISPECIES: response regulator transcription factor [Brevibacterium]|uniref:DNA-binding response regulator, OmpR family, contains REC and winged-helix (WHTH) domain n=2 Tax=Brevibacterium antiquum TaxID=234835 RepID=A0A2H1KW10_9MICO|nr:MULTISPECIES: response regulator transcription factor [Brevibacterium]SMX93188.1 DNA-binding response regulator, OmpR family, contains REC and winged-helix (wHTH) domain [Brevibacterium antiquum]SMY03838.1 DNA-binding response regulator, OmpR family, contains REC and winged-helix (wHTH) domain [Brevibacterium antiquum CNRZ 918]HCG54710.1 DNA-binding response regulator [Brevibacterium sp.]